LGKKDGGSAVTSTYLQPIALILGAVGIYVVATAVVLAQAGPSQDLENCVAIRSEQARLDCLKKLLPTSGAAADAVEEPVEDLWPLIRTPRPDGGGDALAIMRTADTTQSDSDLAGLMIRCREKPGLEVVLALIRPLPPRSKRDVVVVSGAEQSVLHAETVPPGTALALPIDATTFTTGVWRELKRLSLRIIDPEGDIKGVIPLDGAGRAIAKLAAACPEGRSK